MRETKTERRPSPLPLPIGRGVKSKSRAILSDVSAEIFRFLSMNLLRLLVQKTDCRGEFCNYFH